MTDSLGVPYTDGDVDTNNTDNLSLNALIEQRYSRRETLRGGATTMATAVLGGSMLAACDSTTVGADTDANPVVTATSSGNTTSGRVVTLTGTATDDNKIGATAWTQVSGPTVTLSSTTANVVTFLAPTVTTATNFVFQFAAADNAGQSSSAQVTVTVSPAVIGFTGVAKNKLDVVTVPAGYNVQVINRLGDPILAGVPAYANDGTDTNFAGRIGDHGDALYWYGLNAAGTAPDPTSSTRGLIVQNHENINQQYLHVAGPTTVSGARPEAEALKEIECHGVSITEFSEGAGRTWTFNQASNYNRRITPNTPVVFSGPVKGTDWLKTNYSLDGTAGRGTINNCANGTTPWLTAITCEENWAGYFRRASTDVRPVRETTALRRYGVTSTTGNYGWATVVPADSSNTLFRRWNAAATGITATTDYRNEPNQFGWVVEIDPYDKTKAPRKRTALGRMGHEGAWFGRATAGKKLAVYMGDDARGEYIYKFVSTQTWNAADATATDRLAIGDKYLDSGTLYVAKFNADGTGNWMPLVYGQVPDRPAVGSDPVYTFADQTDILVNARLAADAQGATPMDRPEWTAVNPANGEIYVTLTNNNATLRPLTGTNPANPRHYNDPVGATNNFGNPNGHILRISEDGGETAATTFKWDVYLFAAGSDLDPNNINISGLTANNDFSSPDGLWFSRPSNAAGASATPLLWIETDDNAFRDVTNNQMLAALPGTRGDGGARTITNTGTGGATNTQGTFVGRAASDATLKRFLVGPIGCEITGVDTTPDGRTLFVGIQHPGEDGSLAAIDSHWPDSQATGTAGASVRPRSAVVVITKADGGVVGL